MKANSIAVGIVCGLIAGLIDITPMIFMKLSWDANLAAFSMWLVVGFLIAVTDLKMNAVLKGILISFLCLLPSAIMIGWKEPFSLIPIVVMTSILGSLLGFSIPRISAVIAQRK